MLGQPLLEQFYNLFVESAPFSRLIARDDIANLTLKTPVFGLVGLDFGKAGGGQHGLLAAEMMLCIF